MGPTETDRNHAAEAASSARGGGVDTEQDYAPLAAAAVALVPDGAVVGLGTGRTATSVVEALGRKVRQGLRIRGVPTSEAAARLATRAGIPLVRLDDVEAIDIVVDGADEVDPQLDLIKGLGGALVREKIVATAARRFVVVVGADKLVPALGAHGVLPVEVIPFALHWCRGRLAQLGYAATVRQRNGQPLATDNGNHILDCEVPVLERPAEVEQMLRAIPGVVGTGLFLGLADTVLIQHGREVQVRTRPRS